MAEYIEREKVYKTLDKMDGICDYDDPPYSWRAGWDDAIRAVITEIKKLPAADVRPVVHGHWTRTANTWTHDLDEASRPIFRCSVCGRYENRKEPFCNCGAKMDGEDGNDK